MPGKKVIVSGSAEILKPVITQLMAMNQLLDNKSVGTIYGIPADRFQEQRKYKPQVILRFKQPVGEVALNKSRLDCEITFRLMEQESKTITDAFVLALATKIKAKFGGETGFSFQKGKQMVTYTEKAKGYQFQMQVINLAEGQRVAEQILDLQGHTLDLKHLNLNQNAVPDLRYDETPPEITILGQSYEQPRQRPLGTMRFEWAELHLHGRRDAIILFDATGSWYPTVI